MHFMVFTESFDAKVMSASWTGPSVTWTARSI